MPRRGSFERRLLVALVLFSLVPSLVLLGMGALLLSGVVELNTSPATWEGVRRSGLELLVLPAAAVLLALLLVALAFRIAREIARDLARPIRELAGWAGMIAREEPLPSLGAEPARGELAVLHDAFRAMATELEASRVRALEAERTRAWTAAARGVAHELKSSLAPLRKAVRTLERQTQGLPSAREPLEVVAGEAERLEELARSFAQFGHLPEGPASEIDLCEQWDHLLRTHLPPGVEHRLRAPVDLPRVQGHHDALGRAFASLLLNAAEAMAEEGGTVTVKMTTVGDAVEVRVLDSGPGIPEEIRDRLWEPGFTTRSRGTGLGLALVRQTVEAHGGGVWARNRPEGGAEFRVVLPVSDRRSAIGDQPTTHAPSRQDAGPQALTPASLVPRSAPPLPILGEGEQLEVGK